MIARLFWAIDGPSLLSRCVSGGCKADQPPQAPPAVLQGVARRPSPTQRRTDWILLSLVLSCSEVGACSGLAFTFMRKLGAGITLETGHGLVIRKIAAGESGQPAPQPCWQARPSCAHPPMSPGFLHCPAETAQTKLASSVLMPSAGAPHCPAGTRSDGRPAWKWSAPLVMKVASAGLGLSLGFSEMGEQAQQTSRRAAAAWYAGAGAACMQALALWHVATSGASN